MKFIINSNNLKIFCKSISSLAKVGDEIYIEPTKDLVRNDSFEIYSLIDVFV